MPKPKWRSVLYVDDDPDICSVVQATLSEIGGLEVDTAGCGERAIELVHERRPDLVLMDVMMPGLDGPSTLKRLRASPAVADIPVVFMTAKVMPAEVAHYLALGAAGVIRKPFDPSTLCDELIAISEKLTEVRAPADGRAPEGETGRTEKMRALTERFVQRARGDVESLRNSIAHANLAERAVTQEIERIAHSIHGAAAIFGLPEVSAAGEAIERLVRTGSIGSLAVRRLADCIEALGRLVEAAYADHGPLNPTSRPAPERT